MRAMSLFGKAARWSAPDPIREKAHNNARLCLLPDVDIIARYCQNAPFYVDSSAVCCQNAPFLVDLGRMWEEGGPFCRALATIAGGYRANGAWRRRGSFLRSV